MANRPKVDESISSTKEVANDAYLKFHYQVAQLEKRKEVLQQYYEAVVIGKVMILKLRKVMSEGGDDLRCLAKAMPPEKLLRTVEARVASLEHGEINFANLDRARVMKGLKSSAGDARAREAEMSVVEVFKAFRESVKSGMRK